MRIEIKDDTAIVTGAIWHTTWPTSALSYWLDFYRRLRRRKDGLYAQHYDPTVRAIEKAMRDAGMAVPAEILPKAKR